MFRADWLTTGHRQRRRVPQLHAATIRQEAADPGEDNRGRRNLPNYPADGGEMQDDLQKISVMFVLYLIIQTE